MTFRMGSIPLVLVALTGTACGSDDDGAPASGGTSGSAGSAGSGGGGSGSGGVPAVMNPNLPPPSYDCRTDLAAKECVSVSGTYDGEAVDQHCTEATSPTSLLLSPNRWQAGCGEGFSGPGLYVGVSVPVQAPGTFHHILLASESFDGADVEVVKDGMTTAFNDQAAIHFQGAEIAGLVEEESATSYDTVSGTFVARWDPTGITCAQCPPADIHGSFRVTYQLQFDNEP